MHQNVRIGIKNICVWLQYTFLSISINIWSVYNWYFFKGQNVFWIFVSPSKLGVIKRAPDDEKFKFKTCFSTLCPIQITFVEKVRIEMFCKKELAPLHKES